MFCPNCGKQISDTAKVCGYCGHRLLSDQVPASHQPAGQPAPETIQPSSPVTPVPAQAEQSQPAPEPAPVGPSPADEAVQAPQPQPVPVYAPPTRAAAPPRLRQPLPKWVWWLIGVPLAIAVNYLFGNLYDRGFPFLLDMLGTVVITILLGPWAGIIAALGFPLLVTLTYYELGYLFIPVTIIYALGTWLTHRLGWFCNAGLTILGSILTLLAAKVAASLVIILFLLEPGERLEWWATLKGTFSLENLPLTVTFLVIWLVLYLRKKKA